MANATCAWYAGRSLLLGFVLATTTFLSSSSATTLVGGIVSSSTTWTAAQSPYEVTADLTVPAGVALVIEAGVEVRVRAGQSLTTAGGRLQINGLVGAPVVITSVSNVAGGSPVPGEWGELRLAQPTAPLAENTLTYAELRYGHGLRVAASAPQINNVKFLKNSGAAISIDLRSSPNGAGNSAEGNVFDAVSVPSGDIEASAVWGLKGLPYLITSGTVSVGKSPQILNINPNIVEIGESVLATVRGQRLDAPETAVFSDARLSATLQPGGDGASFPLQMKSAPGTLPGTYDLTVMVAAGEIKLPGAVSVVGTRPKLTALLPTSVYAGRTGEVLQAIGSGFSVGASVLLNGAEIPTTFVDALKVQGTLPSQTAGDKAVSVRVPSGVPAVSPIISTALSLRVLDPVIALSSPSLSVGAGKRAALTATVPLPAGSGGLALAVTSEPVGRLSLPAVVTIPEGAASASIAIDSLNPNLWDNESATVRVNATDFMGAASSVTVVAPPSLRLTMAPDAALGSDMEVGKARTITLELNQAAPAGGLAVSLTSSNAAAIPAPVSVSVPAGSKSAAISITPTAAGTADITVTASGYTVGVLTLKSIVVYHEPPKASVTPQPMAVPPTGSPKLFKIALDRADTVDHVLNLAVADLTVATVTPGTITILAGQREATFSIIGAKAGLTTLTLSSQTLVAQSFPIYVATDFSGAATGYSSVVGVLLQSVPTSVSTTISALQSPEVGVGFGSFLQSVSPRSYLLGSTGTMTLSGSGLGSVTAVRMLPADGVTCGTPVASGDGNTLQVPVTVAADAPTSSRQVIVTAAGGARIAMATPGLDRVRIDQGLPVVDSIDPNFVVRGTPSNSLRIRGRNFQGLGSLSVEPQEGLEIGAVSSLSADGTEIVLPLAVANSAPLGDRVVRVSTLAGPSSAAAVAGDILHVVDHVVSTVTPVASPVVGVLLQDNSAPATIARGAWGTQVGVLFGKAVGGMTPTSGVIGETVTVRFTGVGLNGVSKVVLNPADGIVVGTPSVDADGKGFTVSLVIDAAAAKTQRKLFVQAGAENIEFANPGEARFLITAPLPVVESVAPTYLQIGSAPVAVTVRGRNLAGASAAAILPANGIDVSPLASIAADGTSLVFSASASPGALPGARAVVVTTPAGVSTDILSVTNSIAVAATVSAAYGPVATSVVGVLLQSPVTQASTAYAIYGPEVGVAIEPPAATPVSTLYGAWAPSVGIQLGALVEDLGVGWLYPGATGTLTLTGRELGAVSAVAVLPATDITLSNLRAAGDGSSVALDYAVSAAPATGSRDVRVSTANGRVVFADPSKSRIGIAAAAPTIDSISPNIANLAKPVTLTIRGSNLKDPVALVVEPADGITATSSLSVNAAGSELTVTLSVDAATTTGDRVVRVKTWGGISGADPVPANTLHIYP